RSLTPPLPSSIMTIQPLHSTRRPAIMHRLLPLVLAVFSNAALPAVEPAAVVRSEFIYEKAPFPSCHASTIVETKAGLVAAWFGGKYEKHPEVGIWLSRHVDGKWT